MQRIAHAARRAAGHRHRRAAGAGGRAARPARSAPTSRSARGRASACRCRYGGPGVGLFATRVPARAQHARTPRRRDARRRGPARLRAHARDARAAHPPRARDVEHLHQPGPDRAGGHRLPEPARQAGAAPPGAASTSSAPTAPPSASAPAGAGGRRFAAPFFNEFAVRGRDAAAALERAQAAGVLAGVPLGRWYPELDDALLVCGHRDARRRRTSSAWRRRSRGAA